MLDKTLLTYGTICELDETFNRRPFTDIVLTAAYAPLRENRLAILLSKFGSIDLSWQDIVPKQSVKAIFGRVTPQLLQILSTFGSLECLNIYQTNVDSDLITALKHIPNLRRIQLDECNIATGALQNLKELKQITEIIIFRQAGAPFSHSLCSFETGHNGSQKPLAVNITNLAEKLLSLEVHFNEVNFENSDFSTQSASLCRLALNFSRIHTGHISNCFTSNLTALELNGCVTAEPVDASLLNTCENLLSLSLDQSKVLSNWESMNFANLKELNLRGLNLSNGDIDWIFNCWQLEKLDLSGNNLTDSTFRHLRTLKRLKDLALDNLELEEIPLVNSDRLTHLSLRGNLFENADVDVFYKFKQLEVLDLSHCNLANLPPLVQCENLWSLSLDGCPLETSAFRGVSALRSLKRLSLWNSELDLTAMHSILNMNGLLSLDVSGNYLTKAMLTNIGRLSALQELNLSDNLDLSCDVLKLLPPSLHELNLSSTNLTDDDLVALFALPELDQLDLSYTNITDNGVSIIAQLPALRQIDLSGTSITTNSISMLNESKTLLNARVRATAIAGYTSPSST